MKTIEQCIEENKEFLPSLKKLVEEAISKGEDDIQTVFVFIKPNETVVEKIITGNNIAVFGDPERMIITYGFGIRELLEVCNSELAE